RPFGQTRFNALAWSDEVRLQTPIAGWTTTREKTHAVGMRAVAVSRADCDYAVCVAGISNTKSGVTFVRATLFGLEPLVTEIACGCNYHHTTLHQSLAFVADRSAATGEVAHVVWNRKAEVRAVNAQVSVSIV